MFDHDLARSLNFDEQDLIANRAGHFSERQRLLLQEKLQIKPLVLPPAVALIMGAGLVTVALMLIWLSGASLEPLPVLIIVITAGLALPFAVWFLNALDQGSEIDFSVDHPAMIEGKLNVYVVWWSLRRIDHKPCYLQVNHPGNRAFRIRGSALRQLRTYLKSHPDRRYRVYYLNQRLLSIEALT